MPLSERAHRHVDTSRSPTIASTEQFLRGRQGSRGSPTYSPTACSPASPFFERMKHHDQEEDHGIYQKKSVLSKVKEKAKKLCHSLSRTRQEDGNSTPSWGVSLEEDEEEEDAEYLGAPMYESELAPEAYKENARQHPRANPVISEKHFLPSANKHAVLQDREKLLSPVELTRTTQPAITTAPPVSNKIINETISDKLTPAYGGGSSDAAHSISSRIQSLAFSNPEMHQNSSSSAAARKTSVPPFSASYTPCPTCSMAPQYSSAPVTPQTSSFSSPSLSGNNSSATDQIWNKSASTKEYLVNGFGPGDDEKALSQVISEAMSPRKAPGDVGVIEKLRGAVNYLLRNEEPSQYDVKTPTIRASSQIPISTSAQEVGEEENHGRILQEN